MSLLFNMLSRLVITFLPRNKCLLISWLQSPSAVIFGAPQIVSHCFYCFPVYLPWSDGTGCHDLSFLKSFTEYLCQAHPGLNVCGWGPHLTHLSLGMAAMGSPHRATSQNSFQRFSWPSDQSLVIQSSGDTLHVVLWGAEGLMSGRWGLEGPRGQQEVKTIKWKDLPETQIKSLLPWTGDCETG